MSLIATSPDNFLHVLRVGFLQLVRQTKFGEAPDEERRGVKLPLFARLVVPRERVVIIMITLSVRQYGHYNVLFRETFPA